MAVSKQDGELARRLARHRHANRREGEGVQARRVARALGHDDGIVRGCARIGV